MCYYHNNEPGKKINRTGQEVLKTSTNKGIQVMNEVRTYIPTNQERTGERSERTYTAREIADRLKVSDATIRNNWSQWILKCDVESVLRVRVGTAKGGNPLYKWTERALELFTDYQSRVASGSLSADEWLSLVAPQSAATAQLAKVEICTDATTAIAPVNRVSETLAAQTLEIRDRVRQRMALATQTVQANVNAEDILRQQRMARIIEEETEGAIEEWQIRQQVRAQVFSELELQRLGKPVAGDGGSA